MNSNLKFLQPLLKKKTSNFVVWFFSKISPAEQTTVLFTGQKYFFLQKNRFFLKTLIDLLVINTAGTQTIYTAALPLELAKFLTNEFNKLSEASLIQRGDNLLVIKVKFNNRFFFVKSLQIFFQTDLHFLMTRSVLAFRELEQKKNSLFLLKKAMNIFDFLKKIGFFFKQNYGVDIHSCTSLPDIALKVFRTAFYQTPQIAHVSNTTGQFIRSGFRGGLNEIFAPFGLNLVQYDVNSQYPYAMLRKMPAGKGVYRKKKTINLNHFIGFLDVKLITPSVNETRSERKVLFSKELKNLIRGGAKTKIFRSVQFRKKYIFNAFIYNFYKQRIEKENKLVPVALIKLVLVTLYGRLGLNVDRYTVRANSQAIKIPNFTVVKSTVHLAATISAYARIQIKKFTILNLVKLKYVDTDSVALTRPLSSILIQNSIGSLKQVNTQNGAFARSIFVVPKIYMSEYVLPGKTTQLFRTKGYKRILFNIQIFISLSKGNKFFLENQTFFSFKKLLTDNYYTRRKLFLVLYTPLWVKTSPIRKFKWQH